MQRTKEELTRRNAFEAVIRRPYFHVKPLDAAQLSAWSHYIDYMDAKGDEAETRHLFERCLVACARYTGEGPSKCSALSKGRRGCAAVPCSMHQCGARARSALEQALDG